MGTLSIITATIGSPQGSVGTPDPTDGAILMESLDTLLLETGDALLLE